LGTLNDPLTDVCIWDISIFVLSFYTAKVQNLLQFANTFTTFYEKEST